MFWSSTAARFVIGGESVFPQAGEAVLMPATSPAVKAVERFKMLLIRSGIAAGCFSSAQRPAGSGPAQVMSLGLDLDGRLRT
jgi:hypothetical protein